MADNRTIWDQNTLDAYEPEEAGSLLGSLDALATLGTGAIADIYGSAFALPALWNGGVPAWEKTKNRMVDAATWQPRTEEAKQKLGRMGDIMAPVDDAYNATTDFTGNLLSENPLMDGASVEARATANAIGHTIPEVALGLLSGKPIVGALNNTLNKFRMQGVGGDISSIKQPWAPGQAGATGGPTGERPDAPAIGGVTPDNKIIEGSIDEDGMMTVDHWSRNEGITQLDPNRHGEGLSGNSPEMNRKADEDWDNKTFVAPRVNQGGYNREVGLGNFRYEGKVDPARYYDINNDPAKLDTGQSMTAYERAIKDAGFDGYMARGHNGGPVLISFEPIDVKPYQDPSTSGKSLEAAVEAAEDGDVKANQVVGSTNIPEKAPARLSKQESKDMGLWDSIGVGKRLAIEPKKMTSSSLLNDDMQPFKPLDLDSLLGGKLFPAPGDTSDAGRSLLSVNGIPFGKPVDLEGGLKYMRNTTPYIWASGRGRANALAAQAQQAIDNGQSPYIAYSAMGDGSLDFNTMMTDSTLEAIEASGLSKSNKAVIDRKIREIRKKELSKKGAANIPVWKGMDDPDSRALLDSNGALRAAFMQAASMSSNSKMKNFPDIPSIRRAIQDPELIDTPLGYGGQGFGQLTGEVVHNAPDGHTTYESSNVGTYAGGLPEGVPRSILNPTFDTNRRARQKDPQYDPRSFELTKPWQMMDRQWIKGVDDYINRDNPKHVERDDIWSLSTPSEATPSSVGGHLQNMHEQPMDVKRQYQERVQLLDDEGFDLAYSATGRDQDKASTGLLGSFEGQNNPAQVSRPLAIPDSKTGNMTDSDKQYFNAIESWRGLVNVQDGSTTNLQKPNPEGTSIRFETKKPISEEQMAELSRLAADDDMFVSTNGRDGFTLVDNTFSKSGDDVTKEIGGDWLDKYDSALGDKRNKKTGDINSSSQISRVDFDSVYHDMKDVWENGEGSKEQAVKAWQSVRPEMERLLGNPEIKRKMIEMNARDIEFAELTGDKVNQDIIDMRKILGDPDLDGPATWRALEAKTQKGALPAGMAALLASGESSASILNFLLADEDE